MTASSMDFFPCQVPLIGLRRQNTTTSVDVSNGTGSGDSNMASTTRLPPPLPINRPSEVKRVSRNLFGTPDSIEMNQIFRQDNQRKRTYVMERYSFDMNASVNNSDRREITSSVVAQTVKDRSSKNDDYTNHQPPLPKLIAQEQQQYEKRLQEEKCNLIGTQQRTAETTPPPSSSSSSSLSSSSSPLSSPQNNSAKRKSLQLINQATTLHFKRTTALPNECIKSNNEQTGKGHSGDRLKKQPLITDSFNLRKTAIVNNETPVKIALGGIKKTKNHAVEVLELPKSMRVAKSSSVSSSAMRESSALSLSHKKSSESSLLESHPQAQLM